MVDAKKQHYVPKFLLENFCVNNASQLYVYDKSADRIWQSSVRDIASQNKYYDFEFEGHPATLELSLSQMENRAAKIIKRVLSSESLKVLSIEDRAYLSYFIAVQHFRTPLLIQQVRNLDRLIAEKVEQGGGKIEDIENYQPLKPEDERLFHARMLCTEPKRMAHYIHEKSWCLLKTDHRNPFYISDTPVTLQNLRDTWPRGNLGVASDGIEIYLPFSRTITLGMHCPTTEDTMRHYLKRGKKLFRRSPELRILHGAALVDAEKTLKAFEGSRPLLCKPENVENLNSLQVKTAERFIYCGSDSLALVSDMIKENKTMRIGPRWQMA
jgi:hypothetical protein